ncbi:hypothetical protein EV207_1406 [Scopulibacillus darangshiensis]|uniref:Uncharacterized protein n=1 Tax=Scopulibacillus darangshiensis TaxID=442528 RepID=A0A4R2NJP4_9BACL|nr:hypothetical protein [Scopulibacillus darangshiensis]TCP21697.1 hypothetical protein EV207_1406 [Scopulibacillus darangshiensis]
MNLFYDGQLITTSLTNNDERIEKLYDQVKNVIDVNRVVRGEFG